MAGKRPRDYSVRYLNQQFSAMRWLAKQGLTPEEIREFRWGAVDELEKTIRITTIFFSIRYDPKTNAILRKEDKREVYVPIKGTGHEWFFLESKFKCPWMFTAYPPRTWREEGSREALFPLEEVEKACRDLIPLERINVLTKMGEIDTIEISKLNITKAKKEELREELIEEAKVVEPEQ